LISENDYDFLPKISFLAIGCDHYDSLPDLNTVKQSIARMKEVFVENSETALFSESDFFEVYDSTSNALRKKITQLLLDETFNPEVLFIYFIGYTNSIGISDLGLCMQDSSQFMNTERIMPMSMIRIKELIDSLKLKSITPIFIVDSFYFGEANKKNTFFSYENCINEINKYLLGLYKNDYGFFSVDNEISETLQTKKLGIISKSLAYVCESRTHEYYPQKNFISLFELLKLLKTEVIRNKKHNFQAFLPSGKFADKQIIKNHQEVNSTNSENRYSFSAIYKKILQVLWNEGEERALSPSEILEKTGSQSAYGNHRKLSYSPWDLVEDSTTSNKRRLTERGRKFVKGEIAIPRVIVVNQKTQESRSLEDCDEVFFSDL
jgi:hypothetical protein